MLLGIVLALIAAALFRGRLVLRRVELVYWQRRCMMHVAMPLQPALDARPVAPGAPTTKPDEYSGTIGRASIVYRVPHEWEELSGLLTAGVSASAASKGTVFLGRRKSPAGHERLVAVDLYKSNVCVGVNPRVIRLGSLLTEPVEISPGRSGPLLVSVIPGRVLSAGQADPTDESRFVFTNDNNNVHTIFEGRLRDDDTIVITRVRAKPPF